MIVLQTIEIIPQKAEKLDLTTIFIFLKNILWQTEKIKGSLNAIN